MKTIMKLAMGAAVAGTLVNLLMKQRTFRQMGESPEAASTGEGPLESLNDSAGTPASASEPLPAGNGGTRYSGF